MTTHRTRTFSLVLLSSVLLAATAFARKGPLDGAPAVRHKIELRDKRFEVVPTFELSVAADYKNTYSPGVRLEFHISDSISLGGSIMYGIPTDSGLTDKISGSLRETNDPGDPAPTRSQFEDHLNEMTWHGGGHVTLTPWFGKLALFSKAYMNFDIYFRGGIGFASMSNNWDFDQNRVKDVTVGECSGMDLPQCFTNPNNDGPQNDGFRAGLLLGGGLHIFISNWMAVDLGMHNYLFKDNPSGLDFDGDRDVDDDDGRFLSHLFFGVGLALYLPPKAKISD